MSGGVAAFASENAVHPKAQAATVNSRQGKFMKISLRTIPICQSLGLFFAAF
jgi:hypothetical protein